MSDGESSTPSPRKRPTYGLPGPAPSGPAPGQGPRSGSDAPGSGNSWGTSSPSAGPFDRDGGDPGAPDGSAPRTGPLPPQPPQPERPTKRRGLWPLIIGLVLLVIVGPVATVGGIVWSVGSIVADTDEGPAVIEGGTGEIDVAANEMVIVYVPAEDAANAQCTAEGSDAVTSVPTSGRTRFGDGREYEQVLGVVATEDTAVTISCTGTDAPAYLGPYSLLGMAGPLLIGPIIGVLAGLAGLVLVIVGIVLLVRTRRG
ncbi:hypothetical protein ACFQRD_02790 [Brachybacterium sp. GCM10030268]|uniref:hypothetical protein n=1 Tax=Brachybacterium sp. GCM10030268 TaxID=3273382 RepID=UPI00361959B9